MMVLLLLVFELMPDECPRARLLLDALLADYVAAPFVRVFRWFDALERRWTEFLSAAPAREPEPAEPQPDPLEELPV